MSSLGPKKPRLSDDDSSGSTPRSVTVAGAGAVELPMLTKANYHDWSLVMKVSLEALGLWEAVDADKPEHREDRMALAAILRAVPLDMKASLAVKKSAKEAWAAVKTARVGDNRVKQAMVQRLLKEFEVVGHVDGECIDDLIARVSGIAGKLRELGESMEDNRVVRKVLRILPKKYKQVACAIEMFADLDTMSVEDLAGRLRAAEDREDEEDDGVAAAAAGVSRLLLTEEQWEVRRRQRRGKEQKKHGAKGGHGEEDDDDSSTCSGASRSRYRGRCFDCGERGHMARNCPRKKKEQVLLCDADDEPTLL